MDGAILCKYNGIITVLLTGDYSELEKKISALRKVTVGKEIKLVKTTGINMTEVIKSQALIQDKFGSAFD